MTTTTPASDAFSPFTSATEALIGTTLGGRYTIHRLIGAGGMGLVYLAHQQSSPKEVVVKVLAPRWLHDDAAKRRFDREVHALSSLHHPNIVEMIDFGRQDDRAYLVMEYLEGTLLSGYLARRPPLSLQEFVPISAQILKGAGYAHSREIIVRDIKPANVMLCERRGRGNYVKMLDFGLAKLTNDGSTISRDQTLGTLGYIAPETILGEKPDLRVDVYALGSLFYLMVAGCLPFDTQPGSDAAMLYQTVNQEPKRLEDVLPARHDIPTGLVALIHDCLCKDPDGRPADANAVVERLIDVAPSSMFRLPSAFTIASTHVRSSGDVSEDEDSAEDTQEYPASTSHGSACTGTLAGGAETGPFARTPSTRFTSSVVLTPARKVALASSMVLGAVGVIALATPSCGEPDRRPDPTIARSALATPSSTARDAAPDDIATDEPSRSEAEGLGSLVLWSRPTGARITLDGESIGVTPYRGKAAVGRHTIAVDAPGYHRWSSQISLDDEANEPIEVTLVSAKDSSKPRKPPRRRRSTPKSESAPKTAPAAEPSPAPPADAIQAAATKPNDSVLHRTKPKPTESALLPSTRSAPPSSDTLLPGD